MQCVTLSLTPLDSPWPGFREQVDVSSVSQGIRGVLSDILDFGIIFWSIFLSAPLNDPTAPSTLEKI